MVLVDESYILYLDIIGDYMVNNMGCVIPNTQVA